MKTIFETSDKKYRIVELVDTDFCFEDLCGDTYNPKYNTEISPETLEREKQEFLEEVNRENVFGYELQCWNPLPGQGYDHVDSRWGFVGAYSEKIDRYHHYIIEEMKKTIQSLRGAK
jgi:hypothetical protein